MSQLRYKEYPNGKLYASDELSKSSKINLNDVNEKPVTVVLGEAVNMCEFSMSRESNLKNQMSLLASCKSAGILPKVSIYELKASRADTVTKDILLITGSYDEQMKYFEMFYLPKVESIFENLFHSQNWGIINPESSEGNVAQKGFGISSLDAFDNLLRKIRNGDYLVKRIVDNYKDLNYEIKTQSESIAGGNQSIHTPQKEQITTNGKSNKVNNSSPEVVQQTVSMQDPEKTRLTFKINSLKISQNYIYNTSSSNTQSSQKEFAASVGHKLLLANITIQNPTPYYLCFSSQQFDVVDGSNKSVYPKFCGAGISIIEKGVIQSTETKVNGPDEKPLLKYRGILSEGVSFLEWEISPGEKYEDTIVFEVDDNQQSLNLKFKSFDSPVVYTGEYPLQINFKSLIKFVKYPFKKNSSYMELTASHGYIFLVSKVEMINKSNNWIRLSSFHFSMLNETGEKIKATFYGAGDNVTESGMITSFTSNTNDANGNPERSISGGLSSNASFIEWQLGPNQSHEETLLYLIPSGTFKNAILQFSYLLGNGKLYQASSPVYLNEPGSSSATTSDCFIATAAFPENSGEVRILRKYRDTVLQEKSLGRLFISFYYTVSPVVASWIGKSLKRRSLTRILLQPFIKMAKVILNKKT